MWVNEWIFWRKISVWWWANVNLGLLRGCNLVNLILGRKSLKKRWGRLEIRIDTVRKGEHNSKKGFLWPLRSHSRTQFSLLFSLRRRERNIQYLAYSQSNPFNLSSIYRFPSSPFSPFTLLFSYSLGFAVLRRRWIHYRSVESDGQDCIARHAAEWSDGVELEARRWKRQQAPRPSIRLLLLVFCFPCFWLLFCWSSSPASSWRGSLSLLYQGINPLSLDLPFCRFNLPFYSPELAFSPSISCFRLKLISCSYSWRILSIFSFLSLFFN